MTTRKLEDEAETARIEFLKAVAARPSHLLPPHDARCYQPGVTHEHRCIASMDHPDLDHTCECGKVWSDIAVEVRPDPAISEVLRRI